MKLEIEGVRIRLRKLKISDARDIYDNIRDEEVVRWLLRIPDPYSLNDALKFIRTTQYRIRKNKGYVLKKTGRVVL